MINTNAAGRLSQQRQHQIMERSAVIASRNSEAFSSDQVLALLR